MDPITMQRLGESRQQEILAQAERDRIGTPMHTWTHVLGRLFIALGEKLTHDAPIYPVNRRSMTRLSD